MSDDFEKNLRQHLHSEAEETRELPQRLRGRIRDGIAPRTRARLAPQLALAGALVLVAVAVLAFRSPAIVNVITSNFNKIVQPSPSPTAVLTPTPTVSPSGTDLGPFTCADQSGGADSGLAMQLTQVRVAHQAGYDRIVFEFAPQAGGTAHLPAYTVTRQASAQFVKDASGQPVTMRGSAGLHIVFHGASGATSYTGSRDQTPGLPVVQEVEQLGDFEAVLSWGAGLSQPSCIRILELSGPTRLVVDVQTP